MTLQGGRLLAVTLRPSPAWRTSQIPPCLLPPLAHGAMEPTLWGWCEWNDIMPVRCLAQCLARRKASVHGYDDDHQSQISAYQRAVIRLCVPSSADPRGGGEASVGSQWTEQAGLGEVRGQV